MSYSSQPQYFVRQQLPNQQLPHQQQPNQQPPSQSAPSQHVPGMNAQLGYVQQAQMAASQRQHYSRAQCRAVRGMAITQIVMGTLSIGFGVLTAIGDNGELSLNAPILSPIWAGIVLIASGIIGVIASLKSTYCLVVTFMVLNIICSVLQAVLLGMSAASLAKHRHMCKIPDYKYGGDNYDPCDNSGPLVVLAADSLSLIVSVAQLAITIVCAAICCKVICFRTGSENGGSVGGIQMYYVPGKPVQLYNGNPQQTYGVDISGYSNQPATSQSQIRQLPVHQLAAGQQMILGQPIGGQPIMGQPIGGQPIVGQPIGGQYLAGQPKVGHPVASQPMAGHIAIGQPTAGQVIPSQPMMGEPMASEPVGNQLISIEPVTSGPMESELAANPPIEREPAFSQQDTQSSPPADSGQPNAKPGKLPPYQQLL